MCCWILILLLLLGYYFWWLFFGLLFVILGYYCLPWVCCFGYLKYLLFWCVWFGLLGYFEIYRFVWLVFVDIAGWLIVIGLLVLVIWNLISWWFDIRLLMNYFGLFCEFLVLLFTCLVVCVCVRFAMIFVLWFCDLYFWGVGRFVFCVDIWCFSYHFIGALLACFVLLGLFGLLID